MMTKRELKRILKKKTDCSIQHDGWPCGTCFGTVLPDNISEEKAQDFWRSLLVYRGDYSLADMGLDQETVDKCITELKVMLEPKPSPCANSMVG